MQSVNFHVAINDRVRHVPTDRFGRVTGLLAGLEGRRLVNIEYTDETGAIRSHWSLQSEVEPAKHARRFPMPSGRARRAARPPTQVTGAAFVVECEYGGVRRPVAAVFAPDDGEVSFRALDAYDLHMRLPMGGTERDCWLDCDALAHDVVSFIESGASARTYSVEGSRFYLVPRGPIAGSSSDSIVRDLFMAHVE